MPMMADGTSHLLFAMLAQAIRDLRHVNPRIRATARE
jgi:hypothetical protein